LPLGQLLFRRHVGVALLEQDLVEKAFVGLARKDDGAGFPSLFEVVLRAELEAALHLSRTVAGNAVVAQNFERSDTQRILGGGSGCGNKRRIDGWSGRLDVFQALRGHGNLQGDPHQKGERNKRCGCAGAHLVRGVPWHEKRGGAG
jgi:hypothetical protein